MPRNKRPRWISKHPEVTGLTPQGIPETGETTMSLEEFEAIRLSDYKGYDQTEAATRMNVSRQTFGRILKQARYCLAESLVTGKRLTVGGGCYTMQGRGQKRRRHRGRQTNK